MSLLVNYRPVERGRLVLPRVGRAVAEIFLKPSLHTLALQQGQSVYLDLEFGPEYIMHVLSASHEADWWKLKCVGGSGGLSKTVGPKRYRNTKVEEVIRDLLNEVGEKVAGDLPQEMLASWGRQPGIAYQALEALVVNIDKIWRMSPAGEVWVGQETWPQYQEVVQLSQHSRGRHSWVLPALEPDLRPGVELLGAWGETKTRVGKVERVVHHFEHHPWTEVHCR